MLKRSPVRLNARADLFAVMLGAVLLVVAIAVGQEAKPAAGAAILRGRVVGELDQPLAGVLVRVAIPATDMRFVHPGSGQIQFETISSDNGEYRLEIAGVAGQTVVSVDAMKPGHRKLSGMLMRIPGPPPRPQVAAGVVTETNLKLEQALYFKGVVVDEKGEPIPAVEISANAHTGRASGGVERTVSNPNGEFELFNYSPKPDMINNEATKGVVYFSHPNYVSLKIDDVYSLAENERPTMRVVLATGHKISGIVRDTAGKPVPNVMVKVVSRTGGYNRKAAMTDMDGQFALLGLSAGATVLSARDLGLQQKIQWPIDLDRDLKDLDVRLEAMKVPANLKTFTVLGMKLTDTTPEVKAAYDLSDVSGALILDPGENSGRLKIGDLEHGYNFWMVGNKRISSVREFVEQLLTEVGDADRGQYSIRCVYSFSKLDFDGTNTQYLRLTSSDIEQLKGVLEQLTSASK